MINWQQTFKSILIFLVINFIFTCSLLGQNEYLVKLPESYFANNKAITDKSYNKKYFETKEELNLTAIFDQKHQNIYTWIKIKTDKKNETKFRELLSKGKIIHFQNNHVLKVQTTPNDSLYKKQWYHKTIKASESWLNFNPVEKIILAIIDTGIDYNHPDLKGNLWVNELEDLNGNGYLDSLDLNGIDDDGNGYVDDVFGWDFTDAPRFPDWGDYLDPDNDPMDEYQSGHGTQIAGIVAAEVNNQIGIAGLTPQIGIMNLRAGTASGFLEEDDVAQAIVYAVENGARVINMSFGDIVVSAFLKDIVQYAFNQNVVLVASSGNSGTNEAHYPSGFAETISVGATDSTDAVTGFSSWGQTLDMTAPGQNIISCKIGGGYNYSNGTSFSAPMVAAAAAFMLSNYPTFNNEQVRNVLKTSADDLGATGWDPYYGSGRLNLYEMSKVKFASELKIESPKSGEYTALNSIPIVLTIQDADLQNASLFLGEGENPSEWQTIVGSITNQVISDTIAQLDLSSFNETVLVLKLVANTIQGKTKEYRSLLFVDKSNPIISNLTLTPLFDDNRRATLISFETDDVTRGEIHLRPKSSSAPFIVKNLNYETKNHKILINSADLAGDFEFEIHVENLAGLQLIAGGTPQFNFNLSAEVIPDFNFTKLNYTLPKGYILPKVADFDADGNYEFVLSLYDENNSFGNVAIFEFENNQFQKRFESGFPAIPRDFGDSDNDGKSELLLGFGRTSYVLEAGQINGFPLNNIWNDSSEFWVSRISDLDHDGNQEILGRSGNSYKIFESTGDNSYSEKFVFSNPSQGNNVLGPPSVILSDFDADSLSELAFGDYDGDLVVYENNGDDSYVNRYKERLPLPDATDFLTSGFFGNENKPSLIIGTHTDASEIYESEFDARIWSYFHIISESDNNYSNVQRINFFGYADVREFDSGVSSASDPNSNYDFVIFSLFPDLYIFQSNGDSLVPKWHLDGVQSNKVVMYDFDKNGAPEIYFNNGDSIFAYEFGESNRPLPPRNFEAIPQDTSTVQLTWNEVSGTQRYIIYRGNQSTNLMRYDSVNNQLNYTDINLQKDTTYFYAIKSYNDFYQFPLSTISKIVPAKPNEAPKIDTTIVISNQQVQIIFNEPMQKSSFNANHFKRLPDQKFATSAIPVKNNLGVLVSFAHPFKIDTINTILLSDIRDQDKSLLDSADQYQRFSGDITEQLPYIKKWTLEDQFTLHVEFNVPMDNQTMFKLSNYTLEPAGEVIRVNTKDSYGLKYEIILSRGTYTGATGVSSYITFKNIKSLSGKVFSKGNRFSLTKSASNLKNMIVYPQPAKEDNDKITFANITQNTEIKIYDINGNLIKELKETDNDGGVSWNMKNDRGDRIASGIYIYYATNKKETKTGKIAIVR